MRVARAVRGAAVAALVVGVSLAGQAAVASAASSAKQASVKAMRAQLRGGAMSQQHGVLDYCVTKKLRCQAKVVTKSKTSKQALVTGTPIGYGATDLEKAYGVASASSTTGTIAILDAGAYPNLESDLTIYRDTYGLPRCLKRTGCLRVVNYKGGPELEPSTDPDTSFIEEEVSVETALDVQMASAACPKCKILEVQLPPLDAAPEDQAGEDVATKHFATAAGTAIKLGATSVSISYGYDTDHYTDTGAPAKGLDRPGTAIFASSGDDGFIDSGTGLWPQSLPTVISAGGTSLFTSSAARGFAETAWNEAGSGCTYDLPPAVGQSKNVSRACDGSRAASDLSSVADPMTGVAVYDSYAPATGFPPGFIIVGGTSASSPFLAGLYTRAGVPTSVHGPNLIYAAKGSTFHDVTIGSNAPPGLCQAEGYDVRLCNSDTGWDGPTGRGTPKGLAIFVPASK